ncbi:hypothetical protein PTKIN_Ptkin05aG0087300 [Pterospermum kingtungense]
MLCSISTGKSDSNWLDRLHSSKGFPAGDNLDLDHFLANPNPSDSPIINASDPPNSNSESTHSNDKQLQNRKPLPAPVVTSCEPAGDKEWFGIMSNVLSELFNMGEQAQWSRFSRKKTSRKQTNPGICIIKMPNVNSFEEQKSSSDSVRRGENIFASTASLNSREEEAMRESKENVEEEDEEEDEEEEEEKEKGERELLGYSRSEVTVIDTSCDVWKADKLIFRRKNIWKVKDKKGKSRAVGRKKRKAPPAPPPFDDNNNIGICNKKRKISSLELWSLKETGGRECGSPTNLVRFKNAPGDKAEEVCNEATDDLNQVIRKRRAD